MSSTAQRAEVDADTVHDLQNPNAES